jgi:methanogenic corrinoid protein MtbC1
MRVTVAHSNRMISGTTGSSSHDDVSRGTSVGRAAAEALGAARAEITEAVVAREFSERTEWLERYGAAGRDRCLEDLGRHLDYLATALAQDSASLFDDYVAWAAVLLKRLGIPEDHLRANLALTRSIIAEKLSPDLAAEAVSLIEGAVDRLAPAAADPQTFLVAGESPYGELARKYVDALLRLDRAAAASMIMDAADAGVPVRELYLHVFQPVQYEVGRLWQIGEVSVAQEHYCTAATQVIMARLYPRVFSSKPSGRRLIAACVGGDLHEIGLRMVADFFEMDGWDTVYLGANTPPRSLLQMVANNPPDVLAISVTMTFHINVAAEVIAAVRRSAPRVRVLVGGYPFRVDPELWRRIGADGMALDAQEALERAYSLGDEGHAA